MSLFICFYFNIYLFSSWGWGVKEFGVEEGRVSNNLELRSIVRDNVD